MPDTPQMPADCRRAWHVHFTLLANGYAHDQAMYLAYARRADDRATRRFWIREAVKMRRAAQGTRAHLRTIADWA
jgi:hypothetical protein